MDIFDQLLIRGVKIIFWKGPSLIMEERQLLGEVMLKYPLLFSLLPESSRVDTMEFLKKKMVELGVQKVEELNCFRVMNGHLYWQMMQPTPPQTDFELALEEFLFRERLESAVHDLADNKTEEQSDSDDADIAGNLQDVDESPVTREVDQFRNGESLRDTRCQCNRISENRTLSRTIYRNDGDAKTLKEDIGLPRRHFGFDADGSEKGFQDFKVEKRFDLTHDFQNEFRAITFPPLKENSRCNEIDTNIENGFNNRAKSSLNMPNNHNVCSRNTLSYHHGNQQFSVRNGPSFSQ